MKKLIPLCIFIMLLSSCNKDNFEGLDFLDDQADVIETPDDSNKDSDQDGVSDEDEKKDGTDAEKADTDGDGINDGDEKKNGTNPLKSDTDDDGVNDGQELNDDTNPLKADSDDDGVNDGEEKNNETDPLSADSDGDGVNDGDEKNDKTNPLDNCSLIIASQTLTPESKWDDMDCDADGVSNKEEIDNGSDPLVDESNDSESNPLVGNWILKSATIDNGSGSTVYNNNTYSLEYTATSTNENVQVTFTDNPNKVVSSGSYEMVINFSFLGKDYSENITSETPFTSGDWEVSDNKLTLAANDTVDGNYEVIEQSETKLVLKAEVDRVVQAGGVDMDTKGTLFITLEKVQ